MSAQSHQPKPAKKWKASHTRFAYAVNARKRLDDMTPEEREVHDAEKQRKAEERSRKRAEKRVEAKATLDANVDPMLVLGDLPLAARETSVVQSEATMRGLVLAEFPRPNGGRALVILREWNGELRILFTLAFVENGRAVRSRGWTLYLQDVSADGEVTLSVRGLDELLAALSDVRTRVIEKDAALLAQVAEMHAAQERWQREHAPEGEARTP